MKNLDSNNIHIEEFMSLMGGSKDARAQLIEILSRQVDEDSSIGYDLKINELMNLAQENVPNHMDAEVNDNIVRIICELMGDYPID